MNNDRFELICDNLEEIIGLDKLKNKIESGKQLKIYWGTSPTGKPHIGYLIPIIKIAQLVKADCEVVILLADLHAFLDSNKTSWELLEYRTMYYELLLKKLLSILNVDLTKIKFIKGSEYQLSKEYTIDVYKLLSKISVDSAQKGGSEVVKQCENPMMSSLIYPILQVLDEIYLNCDCELGGVDQRKLFALGRDYLPKIGYKSCIHLMNKMLPNISKNEKMSSSSTSKIDLLDNSNIIKKKINKAFCEERNIIDNTILLFIKNIVFPILNIKNIDKFIINRDIKWGGPIEINNYQELENLFNENKIIPIDIKLGLSDFLSDLLQPLRDYFSSNDMVKLIINAYPNE